MKKVQIRCNHCGLVKRYDSLQTTYTCPYCNETSIVDESYIVNKEIQDIKYYLHFLILAVSTQNKEKIYENAFMIHSIDKHNIYGLIYTAKDNTEKYNYIKQIIDIDQYSDVVYRFDVVFSNCLTLEEKKKLINNLKDSDYKSVYTDFLNETIEKNPIMELEKEHVNIKNFVREDKFYKVIGTGLSILGLLVSIIVTLICNITANDEIKYAVVMAFTFIPCVVCGFGLCSLLKIKKIYLKLIFSIAFFIVLSYILTINLHNSNILVSLKDHFRLVILSLKDIVDYISRNSTFSSEKGLF